MKHPSSRFRRLLASAAGLATAAATLTTAVEPQAAHAVVPGAITSAGPLTTIGITPDLNCYTRRAGDTDGEWFDGQDTGGTPPGDTACGTFAVVNGQLFGPALVPAGDSATLAETGPWTPVSQSAVTGTGTSASPYTLVTTVRAGATGVTLVETDTYVVGQEGYATYIAATNASAAPINLITYHAGDCYLQDDDHGFGVVDASTGSAGCQAETLPPASPATRATRVEQLFPLTPGSSYLEGFYDTVWDNIAATTPFPNTCDCADNQFEDNGVGLSWSNPGVPSGTTIQQGVYTSLSPTGIVPATTGNVADAASVVVGGSDGYTVTVHNSGAAAIHLVGVTDLLPAGFAYVANTTTGLTTTNPTVSGQTLTWAIPSTVVAAQGSATLHFGFVAPSVAGDYTNSASGIATETAVVPAGPFAPVHVITVPAAPTGITTAGVRKAVTVGWVAPTSLGNSALTSFDVQVTAAGQAPTVVNVPATALSAPIGGLKDGVSYTFAVRANNLAGNGPWSATAAVGGTKIDVHKLVSTVTYGGRRAIAVTATSGGAPLVGAQLTLLVRLAGKHSWSVAGHATTKSGGKAALTVKPSHSSIYEWVFAGDAAHTGSIADKALAVAPSLSIVISGKGKAGRLSVATLTGKIAPVFAKQFVELQRKSGKKWVNVTAAKISRSGSYAFALNTSTRGTTVYRVVKGHSGTYVTAYSALKSLTVS